MKDLYNKLVPFLRDVFLDVKESDKSFKDYFDPREGNIALFKQTDIFKKHLLQYGERDEIVSQLFEKMSKDFNDGVSHLYMPNQNDDFTNEQKEIFYKLADLFTQKTGANTTPQSPEETALSTTKRLKDAGNLEIIEPLKLNRKTGFIEGKVKNLNDNEGTGTQGSGTLSVMIDPNNPNEIIFRNESGKIAFALENSDSGLGIFIGASTVDVMALAGYVQTTLLNTDKPDFQTVSQPDFQSEIRSSVAQPTSSSSSDESQAKFSSTVELPNRSQKEFIYKQVQGEDARERTEYTSLKNEPQLNQLPGRYTEQGLKNKQEKDLGEKTVTQEGPEKQDEQESQEKQESQEANSKKGAKGKIALLTGGLIGGGGLMATIFSAADII